MSDGQDTSSSLKSISVDKLAPKLITWAVAMLAGVMGFVSFGSKFYVTREEYTVITNSITAIQLDQKYSNRQIEDIKTSQETGFSNMEKQFDRMEKIFSRDGTGTTQRRN